MPLIFVVPAEMPRRYAMVASPDFLRMLGVPTVPAELRRYV